jgi:two-component system sensor kinase FixL
VIRRLRALFTRRETQFEPLDANELVREVLGIVHGDLVMRGVEVVLQSAAALPPVEGDRVELQQVMLNLVINACEAMSAAAPEGRQLTIGTRADEDGVQISFADRGSGFHAGEYPKLFEPFYTTKPQGLGLGLSISRSIVLAHGGRLWGTATPGQGASFHIFLPAHRAGR